MSILDEVAQTGILASGGYKEDVSANDTLWLQAEERGSHLQDPYSKYEQFVEHYYQCNRRNRTAVAKQELVREAQVCLPYINMPTREATWFLMAIIALFCVVLKEKV